MCPLEHVNVPRPTLVPVFVPGEHANVPSFRFLVPGNIHQNHSFGNHPFCESPKKATLRKIQNVWRFLGFLIFSGALVL